MWNTTTRRCSRSSVCCGQRTRVDFPAPSRPENVISIGLPRQVVAPEPELEGQEREDALIQPAAADTAAAAPVLGAGTPERVEPGAHQRGVDHTPGAGLPRKQHLGEGPMHLAPHHHARWAPEPLLPVPRPPGG